MRHHYLPFIIVIIAAILEDDFWYDFILIYFIIFFRSYNQDPTSVQWFVSASEFEAKKTEAETEE